MVWTRQNADGRWQANFGREDGLSYHLEDYFGVEYGATEQEAVDALIESFKAHIALLNKVSLEFTRL